MSSTMDASEASRLAYCARRQAIAAEFPFMLTKIREGAADGRNRIEVRYLSDETLYRLRLLGFRVEFMPITRSYWIVSWSVTRAAGPE